MQIKKGIVLNQVCGESFLVPMGEENIDFSKLIALNESSLLLWKRMEQGAFEVDDLVGIILDEYEIDDATARRDVEDFLNKFRAEGLLLEN
jgi:hypothetical protein